MIKRLNILTVMSLFVLTGVLGGCGYHIAGSGGVLKDEAKSIAIPVFLNKTYRPGVESVITSAIVDEFRNAMTIAGRTSADAVMEGVITRYELKAESFSTGDVVREYRLTVVMSIRVVKREGAEVLWEDGEISDYEDFDVDTSDVAATKFAEREALEKIARDRARIIREHILEDL